MRDVLFGTLLSQPRDLERNRYVVSARRGDRLVDRVDAVVTDAAPEGRHITTAFNEDGTALHSITTPKASESHARSGRFVERPGLCAHRIRRAIPTAWKRRLEA